MIGEIPAVLIICLYFVSLLIRTIWNTRGSTHKKKIWKILHLSLTLPSPPLLRGAEKRPFFIFDCGYIYFGFTQKILTSVYLVLTWMERNICSLYHGTPDILPKIQRGEPLELFWESFWFCFLRSQRFRKKWLIPTMYNTWVKTSQKCVKKIKTFWFYAKLTICPKSWCFKNL